MAFKIQILETEEKEGSNPHPKNFGLISKCPRSPRHSGSSYPELQNRWEPVLQFSLHTVQIKQTELIASILYHLSWHNTGTCNDSVTQHIVSSANCNVSSKQSWWSSMLRYIYFDRNYIGTKGWGQDQHLLKWFSSSSFFHSIVCDDRKTSAELSKLREFIRGVEATLLTLEWEGQQDLMLSLLRNYWRKTLHVLLSLKAQLLAKHCCLLCLLWPFWNTITA